MWRVTVIPTACGATIGYMRRSALSAVRSLVPTISESNMKIISGTRQTRALSVPCASPL